MTQEKPNATLAYKVLDHIGANPQQHNQALWFHKTECGTAGCFAGWSLALSGAQMEYRSDGFLDAANGNPYIKDEALKVLRISSADAPTADDPYRHLFDADNTYEDLCGIVHAIFGPRPDESQDEGGMPELIGDQYAMNSRPNAGGDL